MLRKETTKTTEQISFNNEFIFGVITNSNLK